MVVRNSSSFYKQIILQKMYAFRVEVATYLDKFVRLPHSVGQTLEGDVNRGNRFASEQLLLVTAKNRQCDSEQNVNAVYHKDIPYSKQGLKQSVSGRKMYHATNAPTYLDGKTVGK